MLCPVCKKSLAQKGKLFLCPSGHGSLVTGGFLVDIDKTQATDNKLDSKFSDIKHQITCPHCSHYMHKVDYNQTGIIIDSCTNCHYRWLDKNEINKIRDFKPKINPKDLLFLEDVEQKMEKPYVALDQNPRVPLFNITRSLSVGDSRRTVRALSVMGLYGIIVGLFKSKFLRIAIPLLLLVIVFFFFMVVREFR